MPAREVDLRLVGGRVVTGGGVLDAGVAVDGGTIVAVARDDLLPAARRTIDVRGNHILPGIVDSEAHPGCYVPFEEDLEPESKAAACAGITTWGIQAPSTRLGTRPFKEFVQADDVVPFSHAFAAAKETIERVSMVDCFLTFMMETDAQAEEIPLYCEEYGVTSFKLYMQARRIPAADHNWPSRRAGLGVGIDDGTLYLVMEQVARYGAPAICSIHPENWEIARVFERRLRELGHDDLAAWTDRSPHMLEAQHVRAYGYVAEQLGARMYIQHATTPRPSRRSARPAAAGWSCMPRPGRPGSASPPSTAGASTCPFATATPRRRCGRPWPGATSTWSAPTTWSPGPRPTARPCTARASGTAGPGSPGSRPSCR
jgi:dihydropyrimidinase